MNISLIISHSIRLQHLHEAGAQVFKATQKPPSLIVVILPEIAAELYQAVKQYVWIFVLCTKAFSNCLELSAALEI
jgi:hypothetical protein